MKKPSQHYAELGFAKVDWHRQKRKGFPEVIYCEGKEPKQILKIIQHLLAKKQPVLATRASLVVYKLIKKHYRQAKYNPAARVITIGQLKTATQAKEIAIICAGTADLPVAEEAAATAEFLGHKIQRIFDVGVAGLHRLFNNLDQLKTAKIIIVAAGMEGALPSVVAGLVDKPIIAVPTSIGYGSNFKGLSALLTMLNACSPGIAVVNIDNGFGAAVMAHYILKCA